jgi:hypothetical protein
VRRHTTYRIKVENPTAVCRGVATIELDGAQISKDEISLTDDGRTHTVRIVLGEKTSPPEEAETDEKSDEQKGGRDALNRISTHCPAGATMHGQVSLRVAINSNA